MTNYDPYEQDREDNAVGRWDEDYGQYQSELHEEAEVHLKSAPAYSWEWEPDAIDRKNRLIRAQAAVAHYQAMNPKPVTHNQWLGVVGLGLLILAAITFGLLLIPPAHGQERLPAFENAFSWSQETWDKSTRNCHIDAIPQDAGPGEYVGIDAGTCREAERQLLALPDSPTPKAAVIASNKRWEPTSGPTQYWDKTNKALFISMASVGSFDLAQTCHNIANGGHEDWMPMKSCGSLVGVGIAMGLGMTYLSYQLHRHGHYKLEKIPFIGMITGNTAGIAYSKKNGAW